MTTAYTSLLGLALPVTGELSGTWGDTVNTAITSLLDTAIAGTTSITTDADITLSTTTGASNQARQAIILWNPASGTTTRNITAPAQSKMYTVINASGGTQSIVIRGAGPTTGVTVLKGESALVAWNGSDFIKVSSVGGSSTFIDLTVTGNTILGDTSNDTLTVNATSTFNSPVSFAGLVRLPSTGRSAAAALTPTNPAFLYGVASTYTDTTSSGTLAPVASFYGLAQPTLSTSNVTTYTTAATLYIANAPVAGGSATITNPYALYVASGASYFGGTVTAGTVNLTTLDATNVEVTNIKALDGTASITLANSTGVASFTANPILSGGTANGVLYLNGSKVATSGSALIFDGTNFGIGVTPSASTSNYRTLQIGDGANSFSMFGQRVTGASETFVGWNIYGGTNSTTLGSGFYYKSTGDAASLYTQNIQHTWWVAPIGTAGNAISFTQAMTLATSGNLNITSIANTDSIATINSTSTNVSQRLNFTANGTIQTQLYDDASQTFLSAVTSKPLVFRTANTARMSISAAGNVDILASGNLDVIGGYVRAGGGSDQGTQLTMWTTAGGDGNIAAFQTIFNTGANSARTERMRIANTGRITINNTEYTCINGSVNGKTPAGTGFSFGYNPSGGSGESQLVWGTGGSTYPFVIAAYDGSTTSNIARFTTTGNFSLGNNGYTNATGYKIFDIAGYGSFGQRTTGNSDVFMAWNAYALSNNVSRASGYGYKNTGDVASLYTQNGQHTWYAAVSGTAGAAISFTTLLTLNENGVLALSGGSTTANGVGVAFPETQSASTNANTLDDYEEGEWTPTLSTNGFSGSATLSSAVGSYTKVGRLVYVRAAITMSIFCYPSAYTVLSGLPFTAALSGVGSYNGGHPGSGNMGGACSAFSNSIDNSPSASATTSNSWFFSATYTV